MNTRITTMKASAVLQYLQDGYRLCSHWRYGKNLHYLTKLGCETIYIQRSNINALLKLGKIGSIPFSGDNYEYYLK